MVRQLRFEFAKSKPAAFAVFAAVLLCAAVALATQVGAASLAPSSTPIVYDREPLPAAGQVEARLDQYGYWLGSLEFRVAAIEASNRTKPPATVVPQPRPTGRPVVDFFARLKAAHEREKAARSD